VKTKFSSNVKHKTHKCCTVFLHLLFTFSPNIMICTVCILCDIAKPVWAKQYI